MEQLLEAVTSTVFANSKQVNELVDKILMENVDIQKLVSAVRSRDAQKASWLSKAILNRALFCAKLTGKKGIQDTATGTTDELCCVVHPSDEHMNFITTVLTATMLTMHQLKPIRNEMAGSLAERASRQLHSVHRGEDEPIYNKVLEIAAIL